MTGRAGAGPKLRAATPGWFSSVSPSDISSCLVSSCPASTDVGWNASNWLRASGLTERTSSKCSSGSTVTDAAARSRETVTSVRREKPGARTDR